MNRYLYRLGLALILLAWFPALSAQTPPAMPFTIAQSETPWSALSPEEQQLLSPHSKKWHNYAPRHQKQLLKGADRYLQLSPHEQRRIKKIRGEYQRKTPEERKRLRETYRNQRLKK